MKTALWIMGVAILVVIIWIIYQMNNSKNMAMTSAITPSVPITPIIPRSTTIISSGETIPLTTRTTILPFTPIYGCHNGLRYVYDVNNPVKWVRVRGLCLPTDKRF